MTQPLEIDVYMDRICEKCGRRGTLKSGLCMECVAGNIRRVTKMSRKYEESDRIKTIAERLIGQHHEHLKAAKIAYVMKERESAPVTAIMPKAPKAPKAPREGKQPKIAKARLVPQIYELLSGCDFIIEADEVLWDLLSLEQQEALIDHELCHCSRDEKGWYVRDHDVQEFSEILDRHGLWHGKLTEFIQAHSQRELPFEPAVNQ